MKALILNSGIGKRMGRFTKSTNKCMAELYDGITIIDRQLLLLKKCGINEVVITTGPFANELENYIRNKYSDFSFEFVYNKLYESTNYIYSIFLAKEFVQDDIILMHGDLVFEESVLKEVVAADKSVMVIDSTLPLPQKDFKAVIQNGKIAKVGIEFFDNAYAAQALYKLMFKDWDLWLKRIQKYCLENNVNVYAENALNDISEKTEIVPLDVKGKLCAEVDNLEDLDEVIKKLKCVMRK